MAAAKLKAPQAIAQQTYNEFSIFQRCYISKHPDVLDCNKEQFAQMRDVWAEVVRLCQEAAPQVNWIPIASKWPWCREYMVFGNLDDDESFWNVLDGYDLAGWGVRVRNTVYECETEFDEPWGWFTVVFPVWYDDESIETALLNYYRKICWLYPHAKELINEEFDKVIGVIGKED